MWRPAPRRTYPWLSVLAYPLFEEAMETIDLTFIKRVERGLVPLTNSASLVLQQVSVLR